jgi:hypothetical protein
VKPLKSLSDSTNSTNAGETRDYDRDYEIIKVFQGGSLARTMLIRENGALKIRKEAEAHASLYAFEKLREQAGWIEAHQRFAPRIPRLLGKKSAKDFFSFDLEYYESVQFFDYIHSKPLEKSKAMFAGVIDFCFNELYAGTVKKGGKENRLKLDALVKEKLYGKVAEALAADARLAAFHKNSEIFVNADEYENLETVARKITGSKEVTASLASAPLADIHGDITVDNIICTDAAANAFGADSFVLLDPNPKNVFNTPLVDVAKLSQSLNSGYEFLVNSNDCEVFDRQIIFNASTSRDYRLLNDFFQRKIREKLGEEQSENVLFFEALNYARMLPLKQKLNFKTSMVYYAVLVKLLNDFARKKGLV